MISTHLTNQIVDYLIHPEVGFLLTNDLQLEGLSGKGDLDFVIVKIHACLVEICQELVSNRDQSQAIKDQYMKEKPSVPLPLPSLVPRPHPLTRRNSLVNKSNFLG